MSLIQLFVYFRRGAIFKFLSAKQISVGLAYTGPKKVEFSMACQNFIPYSGKELEGAVLSSWPEDKTAPLTSRQGALLQCFRELTWSRDPPPPYILGADFGTLPVGVGTI